MGVSLNLGALFLEKIGYGTAFTAGFLTFFTPCILPLIPAWLTLVTGLSFDEMAETEKKPFGFLKLFPSTLFFVLGFSLVFCALGAAAGSLGGFFKDYGHVVRYVAGAFLVFFGLYLLGLISPKFLMREHRADLKKRPPVGLLGSLIVGMAFAAGWTPCVGPVLTAILALAAFEQSAQFGLKLLVVFSMGLGLPFLIFSLVWGSALTFISRINRVVGVVNKVLGVLVLIMAALVISGYISPLMSNFY
ncbi:cytochrome C biogenesis protein [Deltaproteobacteria bacterium Smac51]|nr:cytochrome C biogenesis protein [Deltaproteobacteria bacterium Smac51]